MCVHTTQNSPYIIVDEKKIEAFKLTMFRDLKSNFYTEEYLETQEISNMSKQKGLQIEKKLVCSLFKPQSHKTSSKKQSNLTALPPLLSKSNNNIKIYDSVKVARYVSDSHTFGL